MPTTETVCASLHLLMSTQFIFGLRASVPKPTKPDVQPAVRRYEDEHTAFQFSHPSRIHYLCYPVLFQYAHFIQPAQPLNIITFTPLQGYVSLSTRKLTCQRLYCLKNSSYYGIWLNKELLFYSLKQIYSDFLIALHYENVICSFFFG